jgi:hypothetical protein
MSHRTSHPSGTTAGGAWAEEALPEEAPLDWPPSAWPLSPLSQRAEFSKVSVLVFLLHTFSKVSALVSLLGKKTAKNFENVCLCPH